MLPRVRVEEVGDEEAKAMLARMRGNKPVPVGMGFSLQGHWGVVCREESGDVAWEGEDSNLITDMGRRYFLSSGGWNSYFIGTSPSLDTPTFQRYTLSDNGSGNSSQSTGSGNSTKNSSTYTNSWSVTFGTPGAARTIGTIMMGQYVGMSGATMILAYSLLSPPKVQGTTQTLEITYRLTLTVTA